MARPNLRELTALLDVNPQEVVDVLRRAVKDEPGHVACLVVLARAFEAIGEPVDALRCWRAASALCPDSPVIRDELRSSAARIAAGAAAETRAARAAGQQPAVEAAEQSLKEDEPYHELDDLIKELETARIVPDPKVEPVESSRLEPEVEDVVSETLAKIYANQKFYEEAARVYEKLAVQHQEREDEFIQKASEIRQRAS